jgi:hypothetical protein
MGDYVRGKTSYIRAYNELYDNLPPAETFVNGMALIHIIKRKGTGAFYDDHWLNLIIDEVNKEKFENLLKKINKEFKTEIEDIIKNNKPPKLLIKFYYDKLKVHSMRFFIGNPFDYLHYE